MKKIIALPFLFLCVFSAMAQSPQAIPYQAVLRNADGSVIANQAVTITFTIHNSSVDGTTEYQENHSTTSNALGLINLNVGQGTPSVGTFSAIDWGSGTKFLQVAMNNGNGNIDLGTQQMLSVPYAMYAGNTSISISALGDTLVIGNRNIIIPGISNANNNSPIFGCMDNSACNYNDQANINDNSCLFSYMNCNDGNPFTFNDRINFECNCVGNELINNLYTNGDGVFDIDGNHYKTIIINGQEWMQQNLIVSKFNNGDALSNFQDQIAWQTADTPAYCFYNNEIAYQIIYGNLYNFYVVSDSRNICPQGWHIPNDLDWTNLENSLGGQVSAGVKMKSNMVFLGWGGSFNNAINESGFSALPGGMRLTQFSYQGGYGYWWSNSNIAGGGSLKFIVSNDPGFWSSNNGLPPQIGYSIRCLRD